MNILRLPALALKSPSIAGLCLLLSSISLKAQDTKPIPAPPVPATGKKEAPPAKVSPVKGKAKTVAKKEEAKPKQYVVKSGDNPWLIAKNHGVSLEALLKVNDIKDAKNLKIGDVLTLPDGVESQNAPAKKIVAKPEPKGKPAPAAAPKEGDDWVHYTIKKGDNPWSISKKLKVDHQKIISLNEGTDFTKLSIGQQIKIPKTASSKD